MISKARSCEATFLEEKDNELGNVGVGKVESRVESSGQWSGRGAETRQAKGNAVKVWLSKEQRQVVGLCREADNLVGKSLHRGTKVL